MSIKVVKFGGSSLADADKFRRVAEIIAADPDRRYVVPSAPGKRFSDDIKITDMLYQCYNLARDASTKEEFETCYSNICARFQGIITDLSLDFDISGELAYIKNAILGRAGRDFAASRGEYLSGLILAKFIGFDFIDAENVIHFKDNGTFDADRTHEVLTEELSRHERAIIPGFYGLMPNGTVKTFSRGGSDITGSIVARAAGADLYENWTDVSGFMMADPRIIKDPRAIDTVTYRELRELSYMGATVLHEDAIFPVRIAGIPINIRNTMRPGDDGTMIVASASDYDNKHIITGIAGRRGFSVFTVEDDLMNSQIGYGRRMLEVFEENGIAFEHMPTGIDTMSVIVATSDIDPIRDKIIASLNRTLKPDSVTVDDGLALIAVVGRGMIKAKGTAARVFSAVSNAEVNIRMIDQGSSELNIILGIEERDFEVCVKAIYDEFVND